MGYAAFGSVEVMATVSLVLTVFQFASTALTDTLKGDPVIWVAGAPLLPVTEPGTCASPGVRVEPNPQWRSPCVDVPASSPP